MIREPRWCSAIGIEPGKLAGALLAALRNAKPAPRRSIARERISMVTAMDG